MDLTKIEVFSVAPHLEQVLAGILILENKGLVSVGKVVAGDYHGVKAHHGPYLKIHTKSKVILFDTSDSLELVNHRGILSDVTHYFKRSYKKNGYTNQSFHVFPLGLNHLVYASQPNIFTSTQLKFAFKNGEIKKYLSRRNALISSTLNINSSVKNRHYRTFSDFYRTPKEEIVVYNTRLWNPTTARNDDEKQKRELLNERRIEFVRALKKEFGNRFTGGILDNSFSRSQCSKDLLLVNDTSYSQNKYQNMLRKAKVGVSVNGIHSTGWALAEYCAFGLGIVCDSLSVELPGTFKKDINYLEANSIKDLIEGCDKLLRNKNNFTNQSVAKNYQYYQTNVFPDSQVLHALTLAMSS